MKVLDSSALLAVLFGEPGREVVLPLLPEAVMSVVNLSEVVAKLSEQGVAGAEIRRQLDPFIKTCEPMNADDAVEAGLLRRETRAAGLSLGDRCCIVLARRLKVGLVTADRAWAGLDLGVAVEVIR